MIVKIVLLVFVVKNSFEISWIYGRHYPNGEAAVNYMYKTLWKNNDPAEYKWNYYSQYATPNHPYDKNALVNYADGTHFTTCRDANGHLLLDYNHDGEIDTTKGGFAFHEHNGNGQGGKTKGNPFTNFWFDDNWLSRYMSDAFGKQPPSGLSDYSDFTRWRILGGDIDHWKPYGSSFFDTMALDGLFFLASNQVDQAKGKFSQIIGKSGAKWNSECQQFDYPGINENYYFGLILMLTAGLMEISSDYQYLDHYISIRSNTLLNQQRDDSGNPIGWLSSVTEMLSLINSESIASNVLGLGATRKFVFEVGKDPLPSNSSYFIRPYNVLSAVSGKSNPGNLISSNAVVDIGSGTYDVDFFVRVHDPSSQKHNFGYLQVVKESGEYIVTHDLVSTDFASDKWEKVRLSGVTVPVSKVKFVVHWNGDYNMDISIISLK